MCNAGMTCCAIGTRLGINHFVISRLVQKLGNGMAGQVGDKQRLGCPHKISAGDDRALVRITARTPMVNDCRQVPSV